MVERSSQKQHNKETYQDHHQFLFPYGDTYQYGGRSCEQGMCILQCK